MAMSADLPFTRDRANLIARAEQVATSCRAFRVEAHGSHHFCADCQKSEASHIIRALLDEMVSKSHGLTVINEDDGDVTIDFDYANDRVVSIRLGEESSGLSALVDGVPYSLCPLDRVPPQVLALLRTEAKE